jgi:hypothetical protein
LRWSRRAEGRPDWQWMLESLRPPLEAPTHPSRFGVIGLALRKAVFRAGRPVILAEHQVDRQLAHAISSIGAEVERRGQTTLFENTPAAGGIPRAVFPDALNASEVVDVETMSARCSCIEMTA